MIAEIQLAPGGVIAWLIVGRYLGFALLFAFALGLLAAGALMLRFGGKGYTVNERPNADSANPADAGRPFQPADGAN